MYICLIIELLGHKLYDLIVLKLSSKSNCSKRVNWMHISLILELSGHKLYNLFILKLIFKTKQQSHHNQLFTFIIFYSIKSTMSFLNTFIARKTFSIPELRSFESSIVAGDTWEQHQTLVKHNNNKTFFFIYLNLILIRI